MSEKFLRRTWSALSIFLVCVSLNGISLTQGWGLDVEWPLGVDADSRTTYQWAPLMLGVWVAVAIILMLFTSEILRRRADKQPWDRLPGIFGFPNDIRDRFALKLRKVTVAGSATLSLYAGWHLLRKTLKADAFCDGALVVDAWYEHFSRYVSPLITFAPGPRCRLDGPETGVTFFPFWQPWIMLALLIVLTWIWLQALRTNARRRR